MTTWILTVAPVVLRMLGLGAAAPTILKYLPLVIKYAPIAESLVKSAVASWQLFEISHPTLAGAIKAIAGKLLPKLPAAQGNVVALKAILAPHTMSAAEERDWMERKSDNGYA